PERQASITYDSSGRMESITTTSGSDLIYSYDGPLVTSVAWSGPVSGVVSYEHSYIGLRITSISVNGVGIEYVHDSDGLVSSAGLLVLNREDEDVDNGALRSLSLGNLETTLDYNSYGELES